MSEALAIRTVANHPSGRRRRLATLWTAMLVASVVSTAAADTETATQPSARDLEAVAHTLGFVEGIPRVGTVKIGIVYEADDIDAAARARDVALRLSKTAGPGSSDIAATTVAANALDRRNAAFDALFVMASGGKLTGMIVAEAARQRLVTISTDPACLELRSCVLSVQGEPSVSVTLDTALASDLGVKISPIFAMMVKRK
jgi:hypothetical protein